MKTFYVEQFRGELKGLYEAIKWTFNKVFDGHQTEVGESFPK